jgi:hypothetical protein
VRFLEAPSLKEFLPPSSSKPPLLPLHLKEVKHINLAVIDDFISELRAGRHHAVATFASSALGWLRDASRYEALFARACASGVPMRGAKQSQFSLPANEFNIVRDLRLAPATLPVLAWCLVSTTDEVAKGRRRILGEPFVNDICGRDDLLYCRSSGPLRTRQLVLKYAYMIQFDQKSWYDQLPLAESVRAWHGVRTKWGNFWLKSASMGGRGSCESAQGVTWTLATFDTTELRLGEDFDASTIIDNVAFFAHSLDSLLAVALVFIRRCRLAGVQLNDIDVQMDDVDLLPLLRTRVVDDQTFGGERYDLSRKTRTLSEKSTAKVVHAIELCSITHGDGSMSVRNFAAIFGLLFYVAEVMGMQLDDVRDAIRVYCGVMRCTVGWARKQWDLPVPSHVYLVLPQVRRFLTNLLGRVHHGTAVDDVAARAQPSFTIVTDASWWGWAGVVIDHSTRSVKFAQGQWPQHDLSFRSSVVAEPAAIVRVARAALPSDATGVVHILTDHMGMVFAARARGACRHVACNEYDAALRGLEVSHPRCRFTADHVAGATNPLDAASRGLAAPKLSYDEFELTAVHATLVPPTKRMWQEWMR